MNKNHSTGLPRLLVALIVALGVMAGALEGTAHVKMNATVPADGATVASGLSEIGFVFTDAIRITLVKVAHEESATPVQQTSKLPKAFVTKAKIAVQPLAPGAYAVEWTGVGKDGHVMKGAFSFSVATPEIELPEKNAR